MEVFTAEGLAALLQVIAIDLVLAGDNAVVIGLAAAGLERRQRNRAIMIGIALASNFGGHCHAYRHTAQCGLCCVHQ